MNTPHQTAYIQKYMFISIHVVVFTAHTHTRLSFAKEIP